MSEILTKCKCDFGAFLSMICRQYANGTVGRANESEGKRSSNGACTDLIRMQQRSGEHFLFAAIKSRLY